MIPLAMAVADSSHVSAARIATQRLARNLEFDDTNAGRAALVATEAVTNMIRHGGGGTFAARAIECDGTLGLEILAVDSGPGMDDFERSATDGVSTGGTPGTGLGAIRRMSDEFEVNTARGVGTIIRAVLWSRMPDKAADRCEFGAIVVPKPGETASGDAWECTFADGITTFLVADGLGHGPEAARAAGLAVEALKKHPGSSSAQMMQFIHGALRPTRGAAVAVMRHDPDAGEIVFTGIGNIGVAIVNGASRHAMLSHNGIVGHNLHRIQEFRYAWPKGALLVAHSDGLESRWDLAQLPDLFGSHPAIIAAALYRRYNRKRDDVVVLVARAR